MVRYWFDHEAGRMVLGEAAYEERIQMSGIGDIEPILDILYDQSSKINTRSSDVKLDVSDWSDEEYREYGRWVIKLMSSDTQERSKRVTREILNRMFYMGLGPSVPRIKSRFGQMWQFAEAIGVESGKPGDKYQIWTERQFLQHARKLELRLGRKPLAEDYNNCDGPNEKTLQAHVGGVRRLNEKLGYPDVYHWENDEFVAWGARVIEANNGGNLTARLIDALSRKNRGPSAATVINRFGSISSMQVQSILEREHLVASMLALEARLATIWTEMECDSSFNDGSRVRAACYEVLSRLLPSLSHARRLSMALEGSENLIKNIRSCNQSISMADIEVSALEADVFDVLWPIDNWREYLYVDPDELGYIKDSNKRRFTKTNDDQTLLTAT